jgi:hypothetical protein
MKEERMSNALLREFLLGRVDEAERDRIETQFLTDAQTRDRVLAVEEDLIEEYLEDSLTTSDRASFVSHYLQTPDQRRKLRITKSLKELATRKTVPQTVAANGSSWARIRGWLRSRPLLVPIAAMIIIAVVIVAVLVNRRPGSFEQAAIDAELARLNTPASLRESQSQMRSVDLSPVAVRDIKPQTEVKLNAGVKIVELRLPWIQKERYSRFHAEVHRVGESHGITIPELPPDPDNPSLVRLRLPAQILRPGDYQVQLAGINPDGILSPSEEYTLRVTN